MVIRETGRSNLPIPQFVFSNVLGRFGLPRLPAGALEHIKYSVTVDGSAFQRATGFAHEIDERGAMRAFPPPSR
jgi:UDP-glucose 4-epimerase